MAALGGQMTPDRWMNRGSRYGRSVCSTLPAAALLGFLAGGCGEPTWEEGGSAQELPDTASLLRSRNDFLLNSSVQTGMATNGMATNGMATNGLATSGLITNAMNTRAFSDWFNQDVSLANMVMRYVVDCGVPNGSSRMWTNPTTGIQYIWNGNWGLTPGWASGLPASELEQQLITACLAAHTNIYGRVVPISIQGKDALGTPISVGSQEFTTFAQREACFFGNIFNGEGVYAGSDAHLSTDKSSVRACGLEMPGIGDKCLPIHHVDPCSEICQPDLQNNYYVTCSYNGKTYPAITTRIRLSDINVCGDGVCQVSESCGTGFTPDNCMDCGPCR